MEKKHFYDLELGEIEKDILSWGMKAYRAKQVYSWVYKNRADNFSQCSVLPVDLREHLEKEYNIFSLKENSKVVSAIDGTIRYEFMTKESYRIYSVFMPQRERNSICISTQVGCTIGCSFCVSGKVRFRRNLSRGEIIEQVVRVEKSTGKKLNSVLLMGMGEPLLNYQNVVDAVKVLTDRDTLDFGRRHVTLSTVGIVPQIRKFADEGLGIRLALSLHSADDDVRRQIVGHKVQYSVSEVLQAGLYYSRRSRSPLTIEYVMVPGLNDSIEMAQKLAKLVKEYANKKDDIRINLINCNKKSNSTVPDKVFTSTLRFRGILIKNNILAIIREPRGVDIGSGCGQLG